MGKDYLMTSFNSPVVEIIVPCLAFMISLANFGANFSSPNLWRIWVNSNSEDPLMMSEAVTSYESGELSNRISSDAASFYGK